MVHSLTVVPTVLVTTMDVRLFPIESLWSVPTHYSWSLRYSNRAVYLL